MQPTHFASLPTHARSFHTLLHANRNSMDLPRQFIDSHSHVLENEMAVLFDPVGNVFHCLVTRCGTGVQFEEVFQRICHKHNLEGTSIIHLCHIHDNHYDIRIFGDGEMEINYVGPNNAEPFGRDPIWTIDLTPELCRGDKRLPIPTRILEDHLSHHPTFINMVLPNGYVTEWFLNWDETSYPKCMIGIGWYEYCRASRFSFTDQLKFFKLQAPDTFKVVIVRNN
ncbi:uncharacterized protein LOC130743403 [Lotus japonicus]|uniref:uncharacterized protein LOC130732429 n=1 Tax=Lotus japonicus TaxID=34305 RepID=UPI00258A36B9|nr:uncharacterized protein LOC130732429 [Lotus japonicus]XP_057451614.1 uncharacterized protein LOC130743403 [Lotus japonicus]